MGTKDTIWLCSAIIIFKLEKCKTQDLKTFQLQSAFTAQKLNDKVHTASDMPLAIHTIKVAKATQC